MTGTTEISKEIRKKTKMGEAEVGVMVAAFLEVIKEKLGQGEDVDFKNYFVLKRARQVPTMSKFCSKHNEAMNNYKKANKGKGLQAFAGSPAFRKLTLETRKCNGCKDQKQKIEKSTKLLPRVTCKTRDGM
jgi:nucleoid DNA-binding protein